MIKAIVTDIEGTTTSLAFVKDVLFPYARDRIATFVRENGDQSEVRSQLIEVSTVVGRELSDDEAVGQLIEWIDSDKKITALKALQGMLWEAGYRAGDYTGHIYEDAARVLKVWQQQGIELYIYSSGSVFAQKLLFGFSDAGDLTPLFSGYFDTRVGAKVEIASYSRIAREVGHAADEILFLSDLEAELDAAREAGLNTCWLMRDGTLDSQASHPQVASFDEIKLNR